MKGTKSTPIAIIGMACRFPGQVDTPEKLWDVCASARNTWSEWPKPRLNERVFHHPQAEHLGTFHSRGGHFLDQDPSLWDASFFNFTADMAKAMDPQVRILLETAFEAFQTAGLPLEKVAGSQTAVFAGSMFRDYHDLLMKDTENLPRYHVTGNAAAFTANRLSHFFDLRGPSSIRTGESKMAVVGGANLILHPGSSMSLSNLGLTGHDGKSYSFDARAQGYGRGEGIACLVLKPLEDAIRDGDPIRAVIRETGMNQDGRTQTITTPSPKAQEELILSCYDRAGLDPKDTTYVEAHGTGTIAGDRIELGALGAIIGKGKSADDPLYVGSVKANFGHTESTSGLAAVIKVSMMLEQGQIPPQALFENHNPRIDFKALNIKIPTELTPWPENKLRRVSISNFGAGGANTHVIIEDARYLLSVAREANGSAANQDTEHTNGHVDETSQTPPTTPTRTKLFEESLSGGHRLVTNLQLNGVPDTPPKSPVKAANHDDDIAAITPSSTIVTLSARDETSLRNYVSKLADFLDNADPTWTLSDLAYTLNQKRSHFPWRVAAQSSTISELRDNFRTGPLKPLNASQVPRLGFVFTGQGAQWYAMGRELIYTYPTFAETMKKGGDFMRSLGAQWDPIEELNRSKEDTKLNHPYLSFPMSVLLQLALVQLLQSWGISPTATTGHSSGEISAAYAAGALSFEQALAVAYIRGRLTSDFVESGAAKGGMMAVATSKERATEYIQAVQTNGTAVIACINSPSSITISGDLGALERIEAAATADNILARRLKVPAAYHSAEMEALAECYLNALNPHFEVESPSSFTATFSSPVTGALVEGPAVLCDPSHWVRNMVQPVLFGDSLSAMITSNGSAKARNKSSNVDILVELGPHGTLQGPIRQILDGMGLQAMKSNVTTCLKRGEDAARTVKELAMLLHCKGSRVDLEKINFPAKQGAFTVIRDLPVYQWNHSVSYWDAPISTNDYLRRNHARHDLLGVRVEGLNPEQAIWRNTIRLSDLPWLQYHVVQSEILYPAAGLMVMVAEAMRQLNPLADEMENGYRLSEVDLSKAVIIPNSQDALEIQLVIRSSSSQISTEEEIREFVFYSRNRSGDWTKHCQGKVSKAPSQLKSSPAPGLGLVPMDLGHFYNFVERTGPTLGQPFRNVTKLAGGGRAAEATITVPDTLAMMPYAHQSDNFIHPTTLDACFHPAWATLPEAIARKLGLSVPRSIENLFISPNVPSTPGAELGLTVSLEEASHESFKVSISLFLSEDPIRAPIVQIDGLQMVSIAPNPGPSPTDDLMLLETVWQPSLDLLSAGDLQNRITEAPSPTEVIVFDELQTATVNVIHDALQQLTPEVEKNLEWYLKKYVSWMRAQDKEFYAARAIQDPQTKLDLYSRVTPSCVNGRMLDLVAKNLPNFLTKEADPLEVMAKDGFLSEYYANMIKLTRCLNHVEKYVKLFAHQNPGARILEIGAGTGSCTEPALRGLSENSDEGALLAEKYVFTDVSAGFFEAAGKRFKPFASQMQFQKLDIERDPLEQGFEAGDYDLVISCNCLHATTSLDQTLKNVRKLMKPGGKLLLLETTTPHLDQSLTFGLFAGWWLSEEQERKDSPLLSAPRWSGFLANAGFSGVDVALGDAGSADVSNYSAMVATAFEQPAVNGAWHPKSISLLRLSSVTPTSSEKSLDLLKDSVAASTGADVSVIEIGQPIPKDTQCVCIVALDSDVLATMTAQVFDQLKQALLQTEKVLWISAGATHDTIAPAAALHTGLLRTLRMEHGVEKYTSFDLDTNLDIAHPDAISGICKVLGLMESRERDDPDYELAQREGEILLPRLRRSTSLIRELARLQEQEVDINGQEIAEARPNTIELDSRAAYLVIGGLTGVGREILRWLAYRGAKNLVLVSRSAGQKNTEELQAEMRRMGVKLIPCACDISNQTDLERFIGLCRAFMPIRGVINSSLALEDSAFDSMTLDQWNVPLGAKYHGTRNLDGLFRDSDLQFFIMLSSVTGVLGSHGQANYTAGSTYQDAIARSRVARGLPGVSIDLGTVLGAGYVARTEGVAERAGKAGWRAHTVAEVLRLVELAMCNPRQREIVAGVAGWTAPEHVAWRNERRFTALPIRVGDDSSRAPAKDTNVASLRDRLKGATLDSAPNILADALTIRLADMFVIPASDINQSQPLSALGVDSLVAVELRNWLSSNVASTVTIFDVTQSSSLFELAEKVAVKSQKGS
ncbi:hypothetical protein JX266_007493 [Neoarthrinium moseri]|nr:hypothetical protein JX266_007493 [Neoarthrinium moseri]